MQVYVILHGEDSELQVTGKTDKVYRPVLV